MHGSASVGGRNKTRYRRYICSTKRKKGQCKSTPINADYLELAVANVLAPIVSDLLANNSVQTKIAQKAKGNISTMKTINKKRLNKLQKQYSDALVGLGRVDDEETDMAKERIAELRQLVEKRKAQDSELQSKANTVKSVVSKLKQGVSITGKELLESETVFRALATNLIERISVSQTEIQIQFKDITK